MPPIGSSSSLQDTILNVLTWRHLLPAEGAETYAQAVGGMLQSVAGGFGASLPDSHKWARRACIAAAMGGIFLWNYYGGDPSQLVGLGKERFNEMNAKQEQEIANGGETTPWKKLSLGIFRRSGVQAVYSAVTGGLAWVSWAVGSAYRGKHEKTVRTASMVTMMVMTAACGWSMSHHFRSLVMGLPPREPSPA